MSTYSSHFSDELEMDAERMESDAQWPSPEASAVLEET